MSSDSITEIVRFINDDQIIVAPVQAIQIKAVRLSAASGQVCMEQDIIIQPIRCNRVVHIVVLVGIPVLCQLFGAQHQNRLVSILIILYDCQCGKGLAKANTVRKDAAVVLFQLIDDGKHRILLEVIQQAPDFALLKAGCLIRQFIF